MKCLHNFCADCVGKLDQVKEKGQKGVICPVCKEFSTKKDIKVNEILNEFISQYGKFYREKILNKPPGYDTCGQCKHNSSVAYCVDCKLPLCNTCQHSHLEIPALKNHHIIDMKDVNDPPVISTSKSCPDHPGCLIKAHCRPCGKAVCAECLLGAHNGHKTQTIDKALRSVLPRVQSDMAAIEERCDTAKRVRDQLEDKIEATTVSYRKVIQQAEREMESKVSKIKRDFQTLTDVIYSQASLKSAIMAKQDLDCIISSQESLLSWLSTITEMSQGPGVLYELENELKLRIHAMASDELDVKDVDDFMEANTIAAFVATETSENLVGQIIFHSDEQSTTLPKSSSLTKSTRKSKPLVKSLKHRSTDQPKTHSPKSALPSPSHRPPQSAAASGNLCTLKKIVGRTIFIRCRYHILIM